ncbi:probable calcium-binding protein CML44 [Telopea speciosissima]|uniref:probable calcium-binding protein CML44 n=1 Tax=Telopea speciosissima TaxID=54955 RepID=UPI001CC48000|nr:probable calcium-binding protein CML44 [Telopea speciosissima]
MPHLSYGDLQRIFKKLDLNGDGYVSISELHWVLDRVGIWTSQEELEYTLERDNLDLEEFIRFYDESIAAKIRSDGEDDEAEDDEERDRLDLVEAFKVFDLNNDGFISSEELQSVLSRLGLWEESKGDCRSMIRKFDTNSDGLLDFEEFKAMMLLTTP